MKPPSDMELRRAAGLFKVLGHPERIRIATRLADGVPRTQHALLEELPWAQSTLARHLGLMRQRGLITATRHGNEVHLQLADDLVPQLLALITTHHLVTGGAARAEAATVGGACS